MLGFSLYIGTTTSIVAELWAIRFGLQLAQNKGFNHLIVETDSQLAYNWLLTDNSNYPTLLTNLICDCRYLVQVGTQPHLLKNFYSEDNRVTDALAEKGKKKSRGKCYMTHTPTFLFITYMWDRMGAATYVNDIVVLKWICVPY